MLPNNFTHKSQEALQYAHDLALDNGQPALEPIHLLAALVEQDEGAVRAILDKILPDPKTLYIKIDQILNTLP
jgi:ATP-dependent Clp protease ATP-binding subunit ClpB